MGNNSVGLIVIAVLGFLIIIITGKWLIDKKEDEQRPLPVIVDRQQRNIVQVDVFPQYHDRKDFWMGYADGWNGKFTQQSGVEYLQGYRLGTNDKRNGRKDYYDQYCPPNFSMKFPGFKLDIR